MVYPNQVHKIDWICWNKIPPFGGGVKRLFNNSDIPEADVFTIDVIETTYVDMYLALPIYREGPEFAKAKNSVGFKW